MHMVIYLGLLASVMGLCVAMYIYRKKRTHQKLVCPLRTKCDIVLHSTYAKTAGIPNELLGIMYYVIIGGLYSFLIIFPGVYAPIVLYVLLLGTLIGVLFSLYLIALQALVIRVWCAWCLLSAFANALLVFTLFYIPISELYSLIGAQKIAWIIIHNIGFIMGVGAATITDIFFFRFLKDNVITEDKKGTMDTLSRVIWAGLAILFVSGTMLYLPEQARLAVSSKFLLKLIVVGVIVGNGILLNMLVAPRMRQFSFEGTVPARRYRQLSFALGGISIISWYTAFFLGSLRTIPITLNLGLLVYGGLLVAVVIGSQIFERIAVWQHRKIEEPIG